MKNITNKYKEKDVFELCRIVCETRHDPEYPLDMLYELLELLDDKLTEIGK